MPRRYADYLPDDGLTLYNRISTIGSLILGVSVIPFAVNLYRTWKTAPLVEEKDCVDAASESFLDRVFGGSLKPMLAHFVERKKLSEEEIRELRHLLKKAE